MAYRLESVRFRLLTIIELNISFHCFVSQKSPSLIERSAEELSIAKTNKQILLDGASAFNTKPKVGLQFLEEHGVIYSDPLMPREESLARFFKTTPRLDKKLLGDFISRPDQLEVLRAFMRLMQFDGVCPMLASNSTLKLTMDQK